VTDILLIVTLVLLIAAVALLLMLLRKHRRRCIGAHYRLDAFEKAQERTSVRSERKWPRAETNWAKRRGEQRQELTEAQNLW